MASLFGFRRILGVDRSSRLEVFFKIPQNSQENICTGVSFLIKLQPAGLQLYQKRRSNKFYFPVNFAKFLKNLFFIESLQTAASVRLEAFLVSSKILYFPFFSSKLKLDFFELF